MGAEAEKLALTCKVTLPPAGIVTLRLVKAAVAPEKVVVPKLFPLLVSVIPVMAVDGVPVPESDIVTLLTVTGVVPVFVRTTWSTGTFAAPGNWVELGGAAGPAATFTVAGVGVKVAEFTGLLVAVFVGVRVGELVTVLVGVLVTLFVGVSVGVRVGVAVGVRVGVLLAVLVITGVLVGVLVGDRESVALGVLVVVGVGV